MNRKVATQITRDYFRAWIAQDKTLFLSLLNHDVIVKECTGDMYIGIDVAEKWFDGWHSKGNRVISWDISNQYFDDDSEVATSIWNFVCEVDSVEYTFDGVSVIRFREDKMVSLDEYQMEVRKNYPYLD